MATPGAEATDVTLLPEATEATDVTMLPQATDVTREPGPKRGRTCAPISAGACQSMHNVREGPPSATLRMPGPANRAAGSVRRGRAA